MLKNKITYNNDPKWNYFTIGDITADIFLTQITAKNEDDTLKVWSNEKGIKTIPHYLSRNYEDIEINWIYLINLPEIKYLDVAKLKKRMTNTYEHLKYLISFEILVYKASFSKFLKIK